jgi:hypothetical protein
MESKVRPVRSRKRVPADPPTMVKKPSIYMDSAEDVVARGRLQILFHIVVYVFTALIVVSALSQVLRIDNTTTRLMMIVIGAILAMVQLHRGRKT